MERSRSLVLKLLLLCASCWGSVEWLTASGNGLAFFEAPPPVDPPNRSPDGLKGKRHRRERGSFDQRRTRSQQGYGPKGRWKQEIYDELSVPGRPDLRRMGREPEMDSELETDRPRRAARRDDSGRGARGIMAAKRRRYAGIKELLGEMEKQPEGPSLDPNNLELLRELNVAGKAEDVEAADDILKRVIEQHLLKSTKEYVLFMKQCGRLGRWQDALALLAERKARGERPNAALCHAAMYVVQQAGRWQQCLQLLEEQKNARVPVSAKHYNEVLIACDANKAWEQGLAIIADMETQTRRDFFSVNVSLSLCAQGRQWEKALDLMDEMLTFQVTPSWEMYNLVILMAGEGKQWKAAVSMLNDMWMRNILPEDTTYNSVIDVCRKNGRLEEAVGLMHEMRRKGMTPSAAVVEKVAEACRGSEQPALAQKVELGFGGARA